MVTNTPDIYNKYMFIWSLANIQRIRNKICDWYSSHLVLLLRTIRTESDIDRRVQCKIFSADSTKMNLVGCTECCSAVTSWQARWRLKPPASPLFIQMFVQAQIKENIKAPRHWPLWGEFTVDRNAEKFPFDDIILDHCFVKQQQDKNFSHICVTSSRFGTHTWIYVSLSLDWLHNVNFPSVWSRIVIFSLSN